MLFEKFIEEVRENVVEALGFDKDDCTVEVKEITKENGIVLTGLVVLEKKFNIAPTIYLDNFYKGLEEGTYKSFDEALAEIVNVYHSSAPKENFDISSINKDQIIFTICNAKKNEALLEDHPHRMIGDLAMVYRIALGDFNDASATIKITKSLMQHLELSEDELHEIAMENTPKILPKHVFSLFDYVVENFLADASMDDDAPKQYVITNKSKLHGAGTIFYPGVLDALCEKMGEEKLIILPSSQHECIAMPFMEEIEFFNAMVRDVNETALVEEDYLSDHAYIYDSTTKELTY